MTGRRSLKLGRWRTLRTCGIEDYARMLRRGIAQSGQSPVSVAAAKK
jgi:hypothetical protein